MVQTQIELTEQQLSALEKLAKQRQITLSSLIQEGIRNLLQPTDEPTRRNYQQETSTAVEHFRAHLNDRFQEHDTHATADAEAWKEWAEKRTQHALSLQQIHEITRKVRTSVTQAILETRKDT